MAAAPRAALVGLGAAVPVGARQERRREGKVPELSLPLTPLSLVSGASLSLATSLLR